MKNFKSLFLLLVSVLVSSAALTSCNSDTEDYSIPYDKQMYYQSVMSGSYSGKLFFLQGHDRTEAKLDTIGEPSQSSWRVGSQDSSLVIRNFPINRLDSAINVPSSDNTSDANTLRELRTAISQLSPQDVKCKYYVPGTDVVSTTSYGFYVNPYAIEKQVAFGGELHKVYFFFYNNYYGGRFDFSERYFRFNVVLGAIQIDNSKSYDYTSPYFRRIYIICNDK